MSERVPAQNKTSATPSQATQASSPLSHRRGLTDEDSESVGSNSNISQELKGIQPKTIRRSLNWQNISVEAPSRGNGMSLPGGIQRQQEEREGTPAIEPQVSAKKAETSRGELSNLTKATEGSLQPKVDRGRLNRRHISVEAPPRSGEASSQPIQRQQEEQQETPEIQAQLAVDSVQKSALESSNSTISTSEPAQKPLIARTPFNGRNIPVEAPQSSTASSTYPGGIQRLETSGVKEQEKSSESLQMQSGEEIQAKSSEGEKPEKEKPNNSSIQTKLTVGAPGDKYEQEADSMAAKVMTMPDLAIQQPIQRQTGEDTEAVQMQPLVNSISPLVQRKSGEEEEVQMKSEVQRASDGSSVAGSSIENRLASSKGGGSALPDSVRRFMEPRFGADFSSVRVHTDSNAVQMNKELGAQAFAHGSDIYFGAGKLPGNDELTAHELTHVVQQTGGVQTNLKVEQLRDKPKNQASDRVDSGTSPEKKLIETKFLAPSITRLIQRQRSPIQPGPWNPPGNQPIFFYLGNEAHRGIAAQYAAAHSGNVVFTNYIPISTILQNLRRMGLNPNAGALSKAQQAVKPDILNASRRHLYEIKPASSLNQARAEAQMYVGILAAAGVTIALGPTDEPGTTGRIPAPGGFYVFGSPVPGVIVYRYERQPQPVRDPVQQPSTDKEPQSDEDFMEKMAKLTGLTGTALIMYLVISEGSRLFPPRNLIPVP